ncbi:MAG TPA: zinc-binding alcohol dehydrogenase family protein [Pirellulales bacterium]|jgi:alcohol dehydrogenase|nr:zinc-binding alcohol dehydrogenase family protein [Pirellulales bacterium]
MHAIVLQQPRQFESVEIDEPLAPQPGEVLVRVHRVGICGTDISGYLGKFPFYSYPRIPGHELGVEVLAVGADVSNVKPGERCSVEPYINCQTCYSCRHGRPNCCQNLRVLGVHTDGGMRSRFIVPARKLHASAKLSVEQLALVETLAIGCHAVDRAAPRADEHVLVIGAGPIGLSVLEFVRLTGAKITVLDLNAQRLEFCRRMLGIANTLQSQGDGSELAELENIGGGVLPTVVIDATGNVNSMNRSFHYVGHTGRLVFVGIITSDVTFSDPLFHSRELTLLASRNALSADFRRIIGLIEDGRIDTAPWITHHATFASLAADFPSFTNPETGVVKAMVTVD